MPNLPLPDNPTPSIHPTHGGSTPVPPAKHGVHLRHTIAIGIRALRANTSRSILTLLGITIGIASIILVMAIGQGGQNLIISQIQGMGSNVIEIRAGKEPKGPSDFAQLFGDSLKERDYELLNRTENAPEIQAVSPVVFTGVSLSRGNNTYHATLLGTSESVTKILDFYPVQGVFFSREDVRSSADVITIGSKVRDELFGNDSAIGQRIKIKDKTYRVIGVFAKKGNASFFNFDEVAVMPYTTAQNFILGTRYFNSFMVSVRTSDEIAAAVKSIQTTLRTSHNITDPSKDDFNVQTQADMIQRSQMVTGILTALLTSVAAISLVVGGIGIMNIMLVSVTERTQEIGLRKALGATNRDILNQFLIEAVLLTFVGGFIGITTGILLSLLASIVLSQALQVTWQFNFPVSAAIIGCIVSALTGLAFGIYPARQAAKRHPIDALRYE